MSHSQRHKNDNHAGGGRSCRRQLLPILFINETGVSKAHPCLPQLYDYHSYNSYLKYELYLVLSAFEVFRDRLAKLSFKSHPL